LERPVPPFRDIRDRGSITNQAQGGTISKITAPQSKYVLLSTKAETGTQQNLNYYPTMKMI
jgi:hypothetical protein